MSLLSKYHPVDQYHRIQHITPANAGWKYVGFAVYQLNPGEQISLKSDKNELCIVLISGLASIQTKHANFTHLGNRLDPFEKIPPYAVYVPHHDVAMIKAQTQLEIAVCSAPGYSDLPARLITPQDIGVELRGKGRNKRLVHNILPEQQAADSLLVVEVYTDEGNTSSYPSHKHDQDNFPDETYLEETYYHRIDPPQGFCLQRVYTDDRSLDQCMAVYNRDVVKVPRGYHPVATVAGYNNYYLNVMAGPKRCWRFSWEKEHKWINSETYN